MKLFIFSGGTGKEHEISLKSANNLFNCAKNIIETNLVKLEKNEDWLLNDIKIEIKELLTKIKQEEGLVLPIIHGYFGEDGELQNILETFNIKYIGSNKKSMELTIDKYKTGELLEKNNIRVPKSYLVNKETDLSGIQIPFPCIVKPKDEGSSFSTNKQIAK